jgi:putative ABC transport system permease protein
MGRSETDALAKTPSLTLATSASLRVHTLWMVLRTTSRERSYVAACIVTVALTLALNSAIIGFVRGNILGPTPFPNVDRTYAIAASGTQGPGDIAEPTYDSLKHSVPALARTAAYQWATFALEGGGSRQEVLGAYVTPRLFLELGVAPLIGRLPAANAPLEALISHSLWMRQFSGSRQVIGSTILINNVTFAVVGLMPEGFRFPASQELWLSLDARQITGAEPGRRLFALGFADRETSLALVNQQLRMMARPRTAAVGHKGVLQATPFRENLVTSDARLLAYLLLATGAILAALAAMNVAALTAAREITRLRERAVQRALGASDQRILGEIVVAVAGPVLPGLLLGVLLGTQLLSFVRTRVAGQFPYWATFEIGMVGLAWCGLLTGLLVLVAVGAASSQLRRSDPSAGLREGTRGLYDGPRAAKRRRAIVFGQIACAVAMLIVSARLVLSMQAYLHRSPGFASSGLLTFRLVKVSMEVGSPNDALENVMQAVERVRSMPGVASASVTSSVPSAGNAGSVQIHLGPGAQDTAALSAIVTGIGTEFLETLGLHMEAGRNLRVDDGRDDGRTDVIVNEMFAARLLSGNDPLGKVFALTLGTTSIQASIVGVVPDISDLLVAEPIEPAVYVPIRVLGTSSLYVLARAADGEGTMLLPRIGSLLRSELPRTTLGRQASLDELRRDLYAQEYLLTSLAVLLATVAGALALIGIVSLVGLEVARVQHDVAVKLALGANPHRVGARLLLEITSLGIGAVSGGALLAYWAAGGLSFLLYGIAAHGAAPYILTCIVVACLVIGTGTRGWLQLARLDPATALK